MGRPAKEPARVVILRFPESLYAELILLRPELLTPQGSTKYGAMTSYFVNLVRQDLEAIKESARKTQNDKRQDADHGDN